MRVAVPPYSSKETLFTRTDEVKEKRKQKKGEEPYYWIPALSSSLPTSMYYLIYLTLSYHMSSGDITNFWALQVWHFHRHEAACKYNGFSLSVRSKG